MSDERRLALTPVTPGTEVEAARARLERARARVASDLKAVEATMAPVTSAHQRVTEAVRRRPGLMLGGALLAGYLLARLLYRDE